MKVNTLIVNTFKYFSVSLITIFLTTFVFEIILSRGKDRREQQPHTIDRFIRLREHKININKQYYANGKKNYKLSTDLNGYIKPSIIHNDNSINILFLGGSTTECLRMDELKRFPYLVGRFLEEKTNLKINSINSATSGNHSLHSINIFLNKGIWVPKKPQLAVFMHNQNDLTSLSYGKDYYSINTSRSIIEINKRNKFDYSFFTFYIRKIFPNLSNKFTIVYDRLIKSNDEWGSKRKEKIFIDKKNIKNQFKSNLNTFIHIARSWGVDPVLMTQPNNYPLNKNQEVINNKFLVPFLKAQNLNYIEFKSLYDEFNETIRNVANANNVTLIDLEKMIQKDKKYFLDFIHVNEKGSNLVAREISKKLVDKLIKTSK